MIGLAVPILLLGGNQLLQNANDLAALWCVPLTGTARQERQQRGTIIIGNPVHRAFEPTATSTESNTSGYLTKGVMVTFAVTRACFLTTLTFRALRGNHIVTVTLAVYPRLLLSTFTFRALHGHLVTSRES